MLPTMSNPQNATTKVQDLLADALDALDNHRLSVALRRAAKVQDLATTPALRIAGQIIEAQVVARRGEIEEARGLIGLALRSIPGDGLVPDALLAEALYAAGLWWMDEGDDQQLAQRLLKPALASVPPEDSELHASITGSLGSSLATAGDLAAGRQLIREALAATSTAANKAVLLGDLALMEAGANRWQEALSLNRQAVRCAKHAGEPDMGELIQAQHALGYSLLAQGQIAEAGRIARACWRQAQRFRPRDPHWTWSIRRLLANHAIEVGRCRDAVRHLRAAIPAAESSEGKRSTLVAELRAELAELLMDRKPDEALEELEPAVAVLSRERGPWHEDTRAVLRCAARALDGAGQPEESERQYRRLLEHTPREAVDRATLTADLGCLLASRERHAEALPFMRDAFHRFSNNPEFNPEDLAMFAASFADVLDAEGLERELDMMWDLVDKAWDKKPARRRRR